MKRGRRPVPGLESPLKRGRGRPRSPAREALARAVVARTDARARQVARQINGIIDSHVSAAGVALVWRDTVARARTAVLAIPGKFLERRPAVGDPEAVRRGLDQLVRWALEELSDHLASAPDPPGMPAEESRAVARRQKDVTMARAQHATLTARLLDLKARIRPLEPRTGTERIRMDRWTCG